MRVGQSGGGKRNKKGSFKSADYIDGSGLGPCILLKYFDVEREGLNNP